MVIRLSFACLFGLFSKTPLIWRRPSQSHRQTRRDRGLVGAVRIAGELSVTLVGFMEIAAAETHRLQQWDEPRLVWVGV
jgi:hypothetical protein